jgi:uncharacterized protein (PEP-CTERM system associated)
MLKTRMGIALAATAACCLLQNGRAIAQSAPTEGIPAAPAESSGVSPPIGASAAGASTETLPPSPFGNSGVSPPAGATVLPQTGINVNAGNVRGQLLQAFGEQPVPTEPTPAWQILPRITVIETGTDNAQLSSSHQADLISQISPGLTVIADTQRVTVNLDYEPTASIYAVNSDFNQVAQNLAGDVLTTIIPDTMFVDVRGAMNQQSRYGSNGPTNTTTIAGNNSLQNTSFALSPYILHDFDGIGTLQAGYTLAYSSSTSPAGVSVTSPGVGVLPGNFGNSYLTTNHEYANFVTGENFGRLQNAVSADATQYNGTGVLQDAYRYVFVNNVAYALNPFIALLAGGGYENIRYSGTPEFLVNDAVWSFGARLTPDSTSYLTVEYRHEDGISALYVDTSYQIAPRLLLFGGYSEGLTTSQQQLQDTLLLSRLDQAGNFVTGTTGTPVLFGNNFTGSQNDLERTKQLNATLAYVLDRDTLTASVNWISQTLVTSTQLSTANQSDRGTYGSLNWTHQLTPSLQSSAFVQYGTRELATAANGTINETPYTVSVALNKTFSDTLTGFVQYSYNGNSSNFGGRPSNQNLVMVGLTKQF